LFNLLLYFSTHITDSIYLQLQRQLAYKQINTLAWDSINLCAVAGLCKVKCCSTDTIPEQLHLALTKTSTTLSIGWTTLNDTATHTVQYGLSPTNLTTTSTVGGASRTYDHFGWMGHLHNVFMLNLLPNGTTYYYRVGDEIGGWSKIWSFRTLYTDAGSDAHPLIVASVGDMGYGPNSDPTVHRLTSLVDKNEIDLVIHNGDISYADGKKIYE
jgi:phosphodiesterase/alkaline phosphatase D-like protein